MAGGAPGKPPEATPARASVAAAAPAARVLVIDNYDSFTYNLVQYLAEQGADVRVWRNDAFALDDVEELAPGAIVVSPGPGKPANAGLSLDVVRRYGAVIPTLGVCLGHQVIGEAYGARVVRAARLVHGKTAPVEHDGSGPFAGLPSPFRATRYHSLVVEELPASLVATAWTVDEAPAGGRRVLMGVAHREHPVWGVQFHPESVLTEHGKALLANFLALAAARGRPAG